MNRYVGYLWRNKVRAVALVGVVALLAALVSLVFSWWQLTMVFILIVLGSTLTVSVKIHRAILQKTKFERHTVKELKAIRKALSVDRSNPPVFQVGSGGEAPAGMALSHNATVVGNSLGRIGVLSGIGPLAEFASRVAKNPGGFETFTLWNKSTKMRDVFALAATGYEYDHASLLRLLRARRAGKLPGYNGLRAFDPKLMLALARIHNNQRIVAGDVEDAELIFQHVQETHGLNTLGKSDVYSFAEVMASIGSYGKANRLLRESKLSNRDPIHALLFKANSVIDVPEPNWNEWSSILSRMFNKEGFVGIKISSSSSAQPPFDRIECLERPKKVEGPRVSVIVPTYQGAKHISTAIDSLVSQTWNNIEVIVVDDGSDEGTTAKLKTICESYSKVKLQRLDQNSGAYKARNVGLTLATGEFITVHDDDDWSHPQKIQRQVEHLIENPQEVANMSRHVRSSETLTFCRINVNPSFAQPNFSSLMVRRAVFDELGSWDEVTRGADGELRDRIVAFYEKPIHTLGKAPLSFTRTHSASLTAGEISRGYQDPSRRFYLKAYQWFQEQNLKAHALRNRDFAKPLNVLPGNRNRHLGQYDVVFVTDFVYPGGTSSLTLNEIEAAADNGLKVGMVWIHAAQNAGNANITSRSLSVAQRSDVDVLSLSDDISVKLLLIRHPSVLQFAENLVSKFKVDKSIVVVNNPPVEQGGGVFYFDFETVIENCVQVFGVRPKVAPESGVTLQDCKMMARSHEVEDWTWPGFIDIERFHPAVRSKGDKPVVGRHSRDSRAKWPSLASVSEDLYLSNDVYDVQILGGVAGAGKQVGQRMKKTSKVFEFGEIDPADFVRNLDFWVYYHSDEWTESFGMAIAEAMSAGLVVILPKYMESTFGKGAIYREPAQVKDTVASYWADHRLYRVQSELAMETVKSEFSQSAFIGRLNSLLDESLTRLPAR